MERFRAENGLTSARGELISEQQLSELNGQLILAQAETARASARYRQFQSIVDSGPENAVQNSTISNAEQPGTEAIVDLRQRYLQVAQRKLGIPLPIASLVLPMAVSLFRLTSPVQYVGVAAFIAWAYGVELSALQLATGAALAVVISMGSVGLPGQVSFMATNMPVVQSMGLPVEPMGILLAVDTIPDVFATLGNVTADLTATSVVARGEPPDATESPTAAA